MKSKGKLLLFSLGSLSMMALPLVSIACETNKPKEDYMGDAWDYTPVYRKQKGTPANPAGTDRKPYQDKKFVYTYNSVNRLQAFNYDASVGYGNFVAAGTSHLISPQLIRVEALNAPLIMNRKTNEHSKSKKQYVVKPTFTRIKLELAKEIVLTLKDGTVKVYNSDDYDGKDNRDQLPQGDLEVPYGLTRKAYSQMTVSTVSSNSKSVNSAQFYEDLKQTKDMQVTLKDNVYWSDFKGNKTEYKVQLKDFYYSWLRTVTLGKEERHNHGGNAELDKLVRDTLLEKSSLYFGDDIHYGNEYLYQLFGIDSSQFYNENTLIKDVSANTENVTGKALTFSSVASGESNFVNFFNKLVLGNTDMLPAPSAYIDAMNAAGTYKLRNYLGETSAKANEITEKINTLEKTSDVYKAGVYWYGISAEENLYAGAYVPKTVSGTTTEFVANKNYFDTEWLSKTNKLESVVFKYQQSPKDNNSFQSEEWNNFKLGVSSTVPFSKLEQSQKDEIFRKYLEDEFGINYVKSRNISDPSYLPVATPYVSPDPTDTEGSQYFFSDAYSKLMYGATKKDLAAGKGSSDSYISGLGLSFRTIINTAINWDEYTDIASSRTNRAWLNGLASGGSIGGSDQNTNHKTVVDYYDLVNSLSAINVDGNKIDFGETLGTELSPSENNAAHKFDSNIQLRMKSAGFDILKTELAKVIAKFDQENPELAGQKFELTHIFPYVNSDKKLEDAAAAVTETVKELSNGRVVFNFVTIQNGEDPRFSLVRNKTKAGWEFVGWSYDFDSIASGYDGLSWGGMLIPQLSNIATKKPASITQNFPKIAEVANALAKYAETKWEATIPFADLEKLDKKYLNGSLLIRVMNYQMEEIDGVYKLKRSSEGAVMPRTDEKSFDPYVFSAQFWSKFVSEHTNEYLTQLIQEFTSYFNVQYEWLPGISKTGISPTLLNPHYNRPLDTNNSILYYYQDFTINENLKFEK
ncbi:OppA family ABC transporter substrate-binding lipoprotein [[Mycoplasma] anseris]|uniref:Oligopeptide ABC transporter substrate-binding protein n=1 Tax=[Mycoplasma] anseris TaxID=92400 RepID=A0A2Z4NDG5_9BACT|nr:hypothetical protein [[Mycoplasma] anseris]AWX69445.1 hypothetical protein DP065_01595 [[Mycoplasma] anseris]